MSLRAGSSLFDKIPAGVLVILILAIASSLFIVLRDDDEPEGLTMWTFINVRKPVYDEILQSGDLDLAQPVNVELIEYNALRRRLLSGFFSGTPLADVLEVERSFASIAWRGPLEAVGFTDLTDLLKEEGLMERINRPSFSPWTNRGRIFGLPADVHPVLLLYRADIFEAAGINVEELDTWDKFFEATSVLVKDFNNDGSIDQYVFEISEREGSIIEALLLQAGGHLIDEYGNAVLNDPLNVRILAKMADWASGEDQVTTDVDLFSGAGHKLRTEGFVLSWIVPDWRTRQAELYLESLSGKMKLMPLPAWEEGGRRTSSWGGTMLGFPKNSDTFEESWEFAKRLYLSRDLARRIWTDFSVLTPVKEFWDDPLFKQPDPYYMGQKKAQLFIEQVENVPTRSSSPYMIPARQEYINAFSALLRWVRSENTEDLQAIERQAQLVLDTAQANVVRQINRNHFLDTQ